jgi:hypothetical protein
MKSRKERRNGSEWKGARNIQGKKDRRKKYQRKTKRKKKSRK